MLFLAHAHRNLNRRAREAEGPTKRRYPTAKVVNRTALACFALQVEEDAYTPRSGWGGHELAEDVPAVRGDKAAFAGADA